MRDGDSQQAGLSLSGDLPVGVPGGSEGVVCADGDETVQFAPGDAVQVLLGKLHRAGRLGPERRADLRNCREPLVGHSTTRGTR